MHDSDFDLQAHFPFIVTAIPAPPPVVVQAIALPVLPAIALPEDVGNIEWYQQAVPLATVSPYDLEPSSFAHAPLMDQRSSPRNGR